LKNGSLELLTTSFETSSKLLDHRVDRSIRVDGVSVVIAIAVGEVRTSLPDEVARESARDESVKPGGVRGSLISGNAELLSVSDVNREIIRRRSTTYSKTGLLAVF
jgi:hypothetical protein